MISIVDPVVKGKHVIIKLQLIYNMCLLQN